MKFQSLTGLRAYAALLVFGIHVANMGVMDQDDDGNLLAAGMVGVSFFYILSGFLLAWTAQPGDRAKQFYQRRFARVYPAYFVAWALAAAWLVVSGGDFGLKSFLPLTLMQSWIPVEGAYFAVNSVFWSLSCEAFFYLMFPLIFPTLRRLDGRGRLIAMGAVVAIVFGIAWAVDPLIRGSVGHWFLYFFPPTRMLEFILGILVALHMKSGKSLSVGVVPSIVLGIAAYVAAVYSADSFMRVAVTLVPFALIVAAAAQADLRGTWSPFRDKVTVRLGAWSYAFYLLHTQVIIIWAVLARRLFGYEVESLSGFALVGNVALCLVLGTAAAAALYHFVEHPLERKLRPSRRSTSEHPLPAGSRRG